LSRNTPTPRILSRGCRAARKIIGSKCGVALVIVRFEVDMKKAIAALLLSSAAFASAGWAQNASAPAANAASSGSTDEIVKMHEQVRAANREYDKKVAAAKKVYDAHKAAAAKVRDQSIAAARSGTSQ
jgi:hypothetical protein